jgi:hypothetical protein
LLSRIALYNTQAVKRRSDQLDHAVRALKSSSGLEKLILKFILLGGLKMGGNETRVEPHQHLRKQCTITLVSTGLRAGDTKRCLHLVWLHYSGLRSQRPDDRNGKLVSVQRIPP